MRSLLFWSFARLNGEEYCRRLCKAMQFVHAVRLHYDWPSTMVNMVRLMWFCDQWWAFPTLDRAKKRFPPKVTILDFDRGKIPYSWFFFVFFPTAKKEIFLSFCGTIDNRHTVTKANQSKDLVRIIGVVHILIESSPFWQVWVIPSFTWHRWS